MQNEQPIWKYIGYILMFAGMSSVYTGVVIFLIICFIATLMGRFSMGFWGGLGYGFTIALVVVIPFTLFIGFFNSVLIAATGTRKLENKISLRGFTTVSIITICALLTITLLLFFRPDDTFFLIIQLSIAVAVAVILSIANHKAIDRLFWFEGERKKKRS